MAGRVTFHPIMSWTQVRFMPHGLSLIWKCLVTCNLLTDRRLLLDPEGDLSSHCILVRRGHATSGQHQQFAASGCVQHGKSQTSCQIWQMWLAENTKRILLLRKSVVTRGGDSWWWPKVSRPLWTRMLRFWLSKRQSPPRAVLFRTAITRMITFFPLFWNTLFLEPVYRRKMSSLERYVSRKEVCTLVLCLEWTLVITGLNYSCFS